MCISWTNKEFKIVNTHGATMKIGLKKFSDKKNTIQKFALNGRLTTSVAATGDGTCCLKTQSRLHSSEGSTPQKHDVSLSETCDKSQIITHWNTRYKSCAVYFKQCAGHDLRNYHVSHTTSDIHIMDYRSILNQLVNRIKPNSSKPRRFKAADTKKDTTGHDHEPFSSHPQTLQP